MPISNINKFTTDIHSALPPAENSPGQQIFDFYRDDATAMRAAGADVIQREFLFLGQHPVVVTMAAWEKYRHYYKVRDDKHGHHILALNSGDTSDNAAGWWTTKDGTTRAPGLLHCEDGPAFKDSYFLFGKQLKDLPDIGVCFPLVETRVYLRLRGLL